VKMYHPGNRDERAVGLDHPARITAFIALLCNGMDASGKPDSGARRASWVAISTLRFQPCV
jgi:hypothetical protein